MGEGATSHPLLVLGVVMSKETLKVAFTKVRKAVVAAVTVVVIQFLRAHGVEIDNDTVAIILDAAIVSGVVWVVPNSKEIISE